MQEMEKLIYIKKQDHSMQEERKEKVKLILTILA